MVKLFLVFSLFLFSYALYDTCQTAHEISLADLDENKVASFEGDTTKQTNFCWVCNPRFGCGVDENLFPRSAFYKFTLKQNMPIEISTCNTYTNYNTRIAVLTTCEANRAHTCASSNDDDGEIGVCAGGKSQLVFNAVAGTTYYIVVSGTTASDVGVFRVTVKKFENPYEPTCADAKTVSFPGTINGYIDKSMPVTIPGQVGTHSFYGTWFKYVSTSSQSVFIDTCGDYTADFDPELYVFEGTDQTCSDVSSVGYDDNTCGGSNPRININFIKGKVYYILLSMKDGEKGQYRLNLRTGVAENNRCTGAIGITSLPFKITVPMLNFVPEEQMCNDNKYVGMWYTIVGDGGRYIIDTCDSNPNGIGSGYATGIEIYPYCSTGSMGECLAEQYYNCGDDSYIEMELEEGVLYYIRATCTISDCAITLKVDKTDASNNNACIKPKIVSLFKDGDSYEDLSVNASSLELSPSGCDSGTHYTRGGWYAFLSVTEKVQHIDVIVTPKVPNDYYPYIELHSDCSMYYCDDTSSNMIFSFQFAHKLSHNYKILFATVKANKKNIDPYGSFDFWATMKGYIDGDSYSNPYKITTVPFTHVGYIDTVAPFVSACYLKNHNKKVTVNGAWYTYLQAPNKTVIINTCGPETHIDTALEVLKPGKTFEERECVFGNKDDDSPQCGEQARLSVYGFEETTLLYTAVISDPETSNNYGTYRVSFYYDEPPINSKCSEPVFINNFPYDHYTYITKAAQTVITCNSTSKSSLGTWYRVVAPHDGTFYLLADDLSEVTTTIALFSSPSCIVSEGINRPTECIDIFDHNNSPYGHRGSHTKLEMEKGDEILVFVGADSTAEGIVHFKMTFVEKETPIFIPSAFFLSKLFWVILGYFIIALAILTGVLFGILYWFNNRHKIDYGKL
ncbi:hypothetical protein ENUP19_0120G0019 [Entamoeba nuttalli]|uniref:Bacterial pre-peptidase c-terminal domain containing protein n=2 Tax=Entamoeba nuttalli TaxID=412467 RepID=K2GC65_ENTNP|nr:bacterial pre-peptidase c-terminal domain containing protein [Entamoeba nuttalli P19]EKE40126.1 bacterial pre-peptidase c-terminal domain containing protein [Entamoeba nuttalli P19]|eukprot:XP_008857538.1 bacterial pre-peptidase c-terminal domain containing protein [Entamoeba nuttalli P19]